MPRSPAAQLPAGILNKTISVPADFAFEATSSGECSYGKRNSTALKPASDAALNRSRKGTSLNIMVRFAANRGILFTLLSSESGHNVGALRDDADARMAAVARERGFQCGIEIGGGRDADFARFGIRNSVGDKRDVDALPSLIECQISCSRNFVVHFTLSYHGLNFGARRRAEIDKQRMVG